MKASKAWPTSIVMVSYEYYQLFTITDIVYLDEGVGIVGPLLGMASEYELSYSATESVSYLTCLNMSDISTCDFALDDTCPFESFNLITCVFGK